MTGIDSSGNPIAARDDIAYHRRFWFAQRVWWAVLALLVILALLGLFGQGPVASQTATDGHLRIKYERFVHADAVTRIRLTTTASSGKLTVAVSRAYLNSVVVESVTPQPDSVAVGPDAVLYSFQSLPGGGTIDIDFIVRPSSNGSLSGFIESGSERISFRQFVFP